jgi:hypothetical protein
MANHSFNGKGNCTRQGCSIKRKYKSRKALYSSDGGQTWGEGKPPCVEEKKEGQDRFIGIEPEYQMH